MRDKNLFSIIAPLLLEGRQAKGNGSACDIFMAEPLWRSTRGVWGGNNGLGIVQIVGVAATMTNGPPVTIQRCHLHRHSND